MDTANVNQSNQQIGTALVVYGTVQAESADSSIRVLETNSPVYLNDRIFTGSSGMITIIFNDAAHTQLDLGRMANVLLNEDVIQEGTPAEFAEATAEVEQIQEALIAGEFDPTTDLDPTAAGPAAGGAASDGGGSSYVEFSLTGEEVTPTAGAETTGVGLDFLNPQFSLFEEEDANVLAPPPAAAAADAPAAGPGGGAPAVIPDVVPPPPPGPPPITIESVPVAGDEVRVIDEENFEDGTNPNAALLTTTGTLADLEVDFGDDLPGTLDFGVGNTIVIDGVGGDSIDVIGLYGTLTVYDDGTWRYTLNDNIDHPLPDVTGSADSLPEFFPFVAIDGTGDSDPGSITINIYDDGPIFGNPQDAILANEEGNSLVADLNLAFGADGQSSTVEAIVITPNEDNVGEDNEVLDNNGNVVTIGGEKLYWYDNGDGSWSAKTGVEGVVGFTVAPETDIDGYTGNYTVDMENPLDDNTFTISFVGSGGGNTEQRDMYDDNVHIQVTAIDPDSNDSKNVNWSPQGIGVGNEFVELDDTSQGNEDPNYVTEQLIIDFFETSSGEPLLMSEVTFGIDHLDQATGEGQDAEVAFWTAYNGETVVGTGQVIGTDNGSPDHADQYFTIDDDSTSGSFDRVIFTAGNTDTDYRVTSVDGTIDEPADHTFDFDVLATDGDNDTVESTFDVTIDADGNISGGDEAEVISGSSGDDVIFGGGGDDVIFGNEGEDQLVGGQGADTLDGGDDDDVLVGDDVDFTDPANPVIEEDEAKDTVDGGTGINEAFDAVATDSDNDDDFSNPDTPDTFDPDIDTLIPPPEDV